MHQDTHSNFFGIFARKLKRTGVQVARTEACIAKNQEKTRETKSPRLQSPNPHSLMDPDLQNASEALDQSGSPRPKSNGLKRRKAGLGLNRPSPTPIQKENGPVRFIFSIVSLSSLFSLLSRRSSLFSLR